MHGDYREAIAALETIKTDPKHRIDAELTMARCRMQIGEYEQALTDLTALAADSNADWHVLMAELYRRLGQNDDALRHSMRAVQLDHNHAAGRLMSAQLLELLGQRARAIDAYRWFEKQLLENPDLPTDAAWLTHVGVGFLRYSTLTGTNLVERTRHVLEGMLQTAYERVDRGYWPARIAAADLLRDKYNNSEDDGSISDYVAALRINKHLPQAFVGLGNVALSRWAFEEVERRAEEALAVNPNFVAAIHLLGKKLILERRYGEASEVVERALAINPNDLVSLSIQAAAYACRYDQSALARVTKLIAKITPYQVELYRSLGDALGGIRQYAASEQAYEKTIKFDPTDANARTELGLMYMQWGNDAKARETLEAAWALDPFNVRTKNTLELLEQSDKFARHETEHFIIKFDQKHDPGIGILLGDYLESIYGSVTEDYDHELSEKTVIEVYPSLRAFGVRITGKPWIHTVGACTGRVIAMASPRDTTHLKLYDLARVLKHEFTHTVTLSATHNRIPHWLTEGLAVFQEDAPRPLEWCVMLAEAARRDQLFTLESINWGFMRPRRPNDRQMAYAQSEWMCEYIVQRFGYDAINDMLARYRRGETSTDVFSDLFHLEIEAFDREFQGWAAKQLVAWGFELTPPEDVVMLRGLASAGDVDAHVIARLAKAELDAGHADAAEDAARIALSGDAGQPTALSVLVTVLADQSAQQVSDTARAPFDREAKPLLERLLTKDPDHWVALKYLAGISVRNDELDRAAELFKRLQRACPMDPASWGGLAGIYLKRGDDDKSLPQLLELARIEQGDPDIPEKIARIQRRRGRLREAQYWFRQARFINPFDVDLHEEFGDTSMQAGDAVSALGAYRLLTELEPDDAHHFEAAAFAAHKLGSSVEARKLARRAIELDPTSSAGSLLP